MAFIRFLDNLTREQMAYIRRYHSNIKEYASSDLGVWTVFEMAVDGNILIYTKGSEEEVSSG
eukprot:gene4395-8531_t